MVREHGFKGQWPEHLSTRYATHQSLWTAIRGLVQSGRPLPAIAKAMDVDISSWPALDKDDFLIRVLAESSGLPEWDDAMMDGEFQTRSLMITANPSIGPREPQKKGKHKKKAKKSHLALPAPTGLPTSGSPMEEDAPTDNVISQDKCPGFQFTDRTNNGKVPAHGSPPKPAKKPPTSSSSTAESSSPVTKKKKWRVGGTTKVTEFDPSDINKRVSGLEQDVRVIRHDIGQINDAKDNTQLLLHMVLKGQGWTDEQILKTVPAPKEKPELPPSLNMTPKPHSDEPLRTPTVGPTITPDSRSHSAKVSSRKRCSDASDGRTSGDDTEYDELSPLGNCSKKVLMSIAHQLCEQGAVSDDMQRSSLIAAISHAKGNVHGCYIVVRMTHFPENSSQFSAVMARVCGIPSSGTSGPSGVLIWSVGMPRWTGKTLRRGESIPAESCGGDRFDVPLSLCFCSQQAAEQKASELNPPAKRGNLMDAVGAGAKSITRNRGASGPISLEPAFNLAVNNQLAQEGNAVGREASPMTPDVLADQEMEDVATAETKTPPDPQLPTDTAKGERSDATTHVPVPAGRNDADVLTDAFTDAHSSDEDIL